MLTQLTIVQLDRSELHQMIREAVAEAVQSLLESDTVDVKEDKYLTRSELAALLRISLSTVRRRISDGTFTPTVIGGRILFLKADILRNVRK
ncbi:MAG: helix-turn-helix domain-containing protein [Bacteroidetes bacterium]|nr:helix-turn-helix domain-containing protein [Bacteroidota bacterium]